jgi:hypothetical protein
MIHVFDNDVLDIIFKHLDTVPDLLRYLSERQKLAQSNCIVTSTGEENLLGLFLGNVNDDNLHGFDFLQGYHGVFVDEGNLEEHVKSEAYRLKKKSDESSYVWDRFMKQVYEEALSHNVTRISDHMRELFFWLARVNRTDRRLLGTSLLKAIDAAKTTGRFMRTIEPYSQDDQIWVIMALKRPDSVSLVDYLRVRRRMLQDYMLVARLKVGRECDVIGIELNAWRDEDPSQALVWLKRSEWSPELEKAAIRIQSEGGYFSNAIYSRYEGKEFPNETRTLHRAKSTRKKRDRLGRNTLCPCGSGRKYKSCCLQSNRFKPSI